ncbi:MAG: ParB N-terminal domain-containing protein [Proteobacteria bacterium]|nr:ParB N-terminal domain-containing protein [Pseudomonadota bacterium]
MEIQNLPLVGIEIDNSKYRFARDIKWNNDDTYFRLLERSIEKEGIRDPLIVHRVSEEKPHLVNGFKRAAYARHFGIETLLCGVLEETSLESILDIVLNDHFLEIQRAPASRARFIVFVLGLGLERNLIVDRYLPVLDFEPHQEVLTRCEEVGRLPEDVLDFCIEKRFSMKQCVHLSRHPRELIQSIFTLKNEMLFSASTIEELMTDIKDYLRASDLSPSSFFNGENVREIVSSRSLNPQEKTRKFRDLVKELRFPILTEKNRKISEMKSKMGLPETAKLKWDKTLERKEITISIRINSSNKWSETVEKMSTKELKTSIENILNEL